MTKRCSKCKQEKMVGEFSLRGPSRPGQYRSWCKSPGYFDAVIAERLMVLRALGIL